MALLLHDLPLFGVWAAVAWLAYLPIRDSAEASSGAAGSRSFDRMFFTAVALALLAVRAPTFFYTGEFSIDECQFVAQALGYHRNLMPFTQDGHTCGPLNYYILMWPAYLGWPITYLTIRVTGLVLIWTTLFLAVKAVANLLESRLSYALALPLISFYLFAYQPGFVAFSSELFPETLMAAGLYLISDFWRRKAAPPGMAFLTGLLLGAVPFTKLQGGPPAVFIWLIAAAILILDPAFRVAPTRRPWKAIAMLALGGAFVPLLLSLCLLAAGTLGDTVYRYIIVNLRYGAQLWIPDPHPWPMVLYEFAHNGPQFTIYFLDLLIGTALGLVALWRVHAGKIQPVWIWGWFLALLLVALTAYSVLRPRQAFCHYELILPVPTLLLFAWTARGVFEFGTEDSARKWKKYAAGFCFVISFFTLPLFLFEQHVLPYLAKAPSAEFDPVSAYIKSVTTPSDTISNWGYTPEYYVETQLPPGVRDYSTLFEIFPDPQYDYFRDGYLDDLKRNRPKVIVDSVGEHYLPTWAHPIDNARITAYPALADYLSENYEPPVSFDVGSGKPPTLVYVLKP